MGAEIHRLTSKIEAALLRLAAAGCLGEPRGEKRALIPPLDLLTRLRYNPFHAYLERRIVAFLALDGAGAPESSRE